MPSSQIERKLAAIMFTDIAGSTAQMSKDEAVAISLLNKKESVLKPLIDEHNGTYVKSTGDGSLSHFNSAVDAATCAKRFQESIYDDKDLNVRVGIHLGDTIFEKGDIRGDGVNIASRLESMAVEGGVFVSKEVHDQLANQKEFEGVSLGLQSMKGVGRLIEVYGLKGDKLSEPNPSEYQDNKVVKHSDDEVPSIAIIPFENKGKEEDIFYAYGISLDLISDITSAGLIRVASKKQIDDAGDLPQDELAKVLDVRYMANGELWRMRDMFQLSVELYDTKDKKVVWSDRWQEKWDNLPTIKGSLSEGLLKALDTTSKVEKKVETTNPETYEYYLKAKYKYGKRKNIEDMEIIRGLLQKAIELDDNFLYAKSFLGTTYWAISDYDKAMEIYSKTLKQADELGDKRIMGISLGNIANYYRGKNDFNTAFDYYTRCIEIIENIGDKYHLGTVLNNFGSLFSMKSDYKKNIYYLTLSLKIWEKLDDMRGTAGVLGNIGNSYANQGDLNKAMGYFNRSIEIYKKFGIESGLGNVISNIGMVYNNKGDNKKALDFFIRSLKKCKELGDKRGMGNSLNNIGLVYKDKADYDKALDYLEKSLKIQKEIGYKRKELETTINLYLTYKHLDKKYDIKEIHRLIKEAEDIEFNLNYQLYELLEDKSYLETAYNQIQEKADNLEPDVAAKFLSYPIPKAIVEEWEKIK